MKNKNSFTVKWNVPFLFAGNWRLNYIDKGQISRRVLTANFERNVYAPDATLKSRIIKTELPAFIYKCIKNYKELIESNPLSIWDVCPEYFKEEQLEHKMERNPLFKFLFENYEYDEDKNSYILMEDVRREFGEYKGKSVRTLDNGTFGQVDKRYTIERVKICGSCNKIANSDCCVEYNNKNRKDRKIIRHMKSIN